MRGMRGKRMAKVKDIQKAISNLRKEEFTRFKRWFEKYEEAKLMHELKRDSEDLLDITKRLHEPTIPFKKVLKELRLDKKI